MKAVAWYRLALAAAIALAVNPIASGLAAAGIPSPAPGAVDDSYSVDEDGILQVDAPGLLENDHPGATTCVPGVEGAGMIGDLDVQPSGAFTYTPPADFHGETSFVYGVQADGLPECAGPSDSEATVTITVQPVNDAPTARADSFQALRDRTLNLAGPGVLANDGDVDGDPLVAVKASNPAHGSVTLAQDGGFSYTPNAGYIGPDGFSYRASDGTATSPVRIVSITVTAIPTPAPTIAPSAAPTADTTPTEGPSPTASADAPASDDPFESASASAGPSAGGPLATPSPSILPAPVDDAGGLSIPTLVVGLLLLSLLAFGGAFLLPKWLERRRADASIDQGRTGTP